MEPNELIVCRDVSLGYEGQSVLTHLDLTECYMLEHIGRGVAALPELQAVLERMGVPEAACMARVQGMIAAHDRDSDGRVDFHEFKAMMAAGM